MHTYKIILVGDGGCGKTAWVSRLDAEQTGGKLFEQKYIPTMGADVVPIVARSPTDGSQYIATIWDCAGQEKFSGLQDGYYIQAQAAIFAFHLDSRESLQKIPAFIRDVLRMVDPIPYVIVGFKSDVRTISKAAILKFLGPNVCYVEVSTKTGLNVHEPLKMLHRQLNQITVDVIQSKL